MRRLFWVGIGAVAAVAAARKLGLIEIPGARPQDRAAGTPLVAAARGVFAAGRTAGGVQHALRQARQDLTSGMAEREAELRHGLIGDVDVDQIRAERAAGGGPRLRRPATDEADADGADGTAPPSWHTDPEARAAARRARARQGWADAPTEDPEDDGDVPYSFF